MAQEMRIKPEAFAQRLAEVQKAMAQRGLEGLIVYGLGTQRVGGLTYLSDFRPAPARNEGFQGAGCHALVLTGEGPGLLVSPLYPAGEGLANVAGIKVGVDFSAELVAAVREQGLATAKLGLAGSDLMPAQVWHWLQKALPKAEVEPADDILRELRAIKSPQEIELLSKAAYVGEQALAAGADQPLPGMSAWQLELALRGAAYQAGAEAIAQVAVRSGAVLKSGGRSLADGRALADGDLVMMSLSGWCGGYAFSSTKVVVAGQAGQHQRDHLQHAEDAAQYMVETMQPNRAVGYVTSLHGGQTISPAAHGIGLEAYEHPWIITGPMARKPVVAPGMVICVEPILMDGDLGALTISKTVLVTDQGPYVLGVPTA